MINKVFLIGNLGNDVELQYTQSGVAVANFNIATSEKWKDKNTGEQQQQTEWHRIVAWNQLAEVCNEHLRKGSSVYIEGKITYRKWKDNNDNEKQVTEIQAREVKFLGGK